MPGAASEADAWLLTVVLDSLAGTSELQILDARDLAAGPLARARLPAHHAARLPRLLAGLTSRQPRELPPRLRG